MKLTAEISNPADQGTVWWDNVNQMAKMVTQFRTQGLLAITAVKAGIPIAELLVSRFPYRYPDWPKPPSMHVELTDACNLRCVYCDNPYFRPPRTMMSRETIQNLISPLRTARIGRVCVGGGEATLHPHFAEFVLSIRQIAKIMTIVTNGQWERPEIAKAMLSTPFDLIEISVDVGGASHYEGSRRGASFEKLMGNLAFLQQEKKRLKSPSQINIRLMVRPSQRATWKHEKKHWKKYSDTLYPMHLVQPDDVPAQEDLYVSKYGPSGAYPRCTLPFRNIQVRANGDVPLCQIAGSNSNRRLIVGNVNQTSIPELWNSPLLRQYRTAHRQQDTAAMPNCRGCVGV